MPIVFSYYVFLASFNYFIFRDRSSGSRKLGYEVILAKERFYISSSSHRVFDSERDKPMLNS